MTTITIATGTSSLGITVAGGGTVDVQADAYVLPQAPTYLYGLLLQSGVYTVNVNGGVLGAVGASGINLDAFELSVNSKLNIGAEGDVAVIAGGGLGKGISCLQATDIINSGRIYGDEYGIYIDSGNLIAHKMIVNNNKSGIVDGDVAGISQISALMALNTINSGHIHGQFYSIFSLGSSAITNSGDLAGDVRLSPYADILSNAGTITGHIDFRQGANLCTNSGSIGGNVDFGFDGDKLTNSGTINGNVHMGGGDDKLINSGVIAGIIDLGGGNDSFTGGNSAETVQDTYGNGIYKFGAGTDYYFAHVIGGDSGVDTVDGGTGFDTYDAGAAGGESVLVNLDTIGHTFYTGAFTLSANAKTALGNEIGPDHITGFERILGSTSNDGIYGGSAVHSIFGYGGNDAIFGGGGNDSIDGGDGSDYLVGGMGNDILDGGSGLGADFLIGGLGADTLTGGTSNDTFVFLSVKDSGITRATRDTITDFETGSDVIDLHAIDANSTTAGVNDDFVYYGQNYYLGVVVFHHVAGELHSFWKGSQTILEGDVNGDGKADFSIALNGNINLSTDADILL